MSGADVEKMCGRRGTLTIGRRRGVHRSRRGGCPGPAEDIGRVRVGTSARSPTETARSTSSTGQASRPCPEHRRHCAPFGAVCRGHAGTSNGSALVSAHPAGIRSGSSTSPGSEPPTRSGSWTTMARQGAEVDHGVPGSPAPRVWANSVKVRPGPTIASPYVTQAGCPHGVHAGPSAGGRQV